MRGDLVVALAAHVEPEVERDLVVAAPTGMELGAGTARDLGDAAFDRGVDVLVGGSEREGAVGQLRADPIERGMDHRALFGGQQSDVLQHRHVRARAREVVDREPLIERQADGERQQFVGGPFTEAAVPQRLSARGRPAHRFAPGPCRRDHVSADSPQSRTNPSESWWRTRLRRRTSRGRGRTDRAGPDGRRRSNARARAATAPRRSRRAASRGRTLRARA